MAGTQITIGINQVESQRLGYQAISLSNLDSTDEPQILAGSKVEVGDALFSFDSNESISGWGAISNGNVVYIKLVVSGSNLTAEFTDTAPTWNTAKQGWYDSDDRYIAKLYKNSSTVYPRKEMLDDLETDQARRKTGNFTGENETLRMLLRRMANARISDAGGTARTGGGVYLFDGSAALNAAMRIYVGDSVKTRLVIPYGIVAGVETWAATTVLGTDTLRRIRSSSSKQVAVAIATGGSGDSIASSANGTSWTNRNAGFGADDIQGLHFHEDAGIWVAVGDNGEIATSPDGTNWTQRTTPGTNLLTDVAYSPTLDQWVAVGGTGSSGVIWSSEDNGITWTARATGLADDLQGIAWGLNRWIAGGEDGFMRYSYDGITWTVLSNVPPFQSSGTWDNILEVEDYRDPRAPDEAAIILLSTDYNEVYCTTDDGETWFRYRSGQSAYGNNEAVRSITGDNGVLLITGPTNGGDANQMLWTEPLCDWHPAHAGQQV
jgi:hypothetical protein